MIRRRRHRRYHTIRALHVDFNMRLLTDDELSSVVRVFDAGMGIAYAAHICNQPRSKATCR